MKHFLLITFALAFGCSLSQAALIQLHFDDFVSPVDGLTAHGINFHYALQGQPSTTAIYGESFPADALIGSTVLLGNAEDDIDPTDFGLLTLDFIDPTTVFNFTLALTTSANDGVTLRLFDTATNAIAPVFIDTAPDPLCDPNNAVCFSEVSYTYTGNVALGQAQIDFSTSHAANFAIGTLQYESTQVPEPVSAFLFLGGAAVICLAARKRLLA